MLRAQTSRLALATLRLTLRALAGTNRRLAEKSRRGLFPGRIRPSSLLFD